MGYQKDTIASFFERTSALNRSKSLEASSVDNQLDVFVSTYLHSDLCRLHIETHRAYAFSI